MLFCRILGQIELIICDSSQPFIKQLNGKWISKDLVPALTIVICICSHCMCTLTGSLPKNASFAMHAALMSHYIYGASYPRGGASEIPFHLIPVIEKSGGKVLVRAPVSKIICDGSRAVGM